MEISQELYDYLDYLGIVHEVNSSRSENVGNSDYSKHFLQAWTIWDSYPNLTAKDKDILKRVLREKEEPGISPIQSRILDYKKIIHISQERIRQLELLLNAEIPLMYETEDDQLINKQCKYYESLTENT